MFVACAVPPEGTAVIDVLDTLSPTVAEVAARIASEVVGADGTLHPDFATAMFCNDMDAEQTAFTLSLLVPEAVGVISQPVDLAGLRRPIPKTYVRLLRDASLTVDAGSHGRQHRRGRSRRPRRRPHGDDQPTSSARPDPRRTLSSSPYHRRGGSRCSALLRRDQ